MILHRREGWMLPLMTLVCIWNLTGVWKDSVARAQEDNATRIIAGLHSAERVIEDLQYMVVDLAGKQVSWENNVFPNLDIFLIGVSLDQPVRFDLMFDAEHGYQLQPIIPVANLKEFLEDNLEPIDILPSRDRTDRELYALGGTVYEGWLRYLPSPSPYAVIYPQKEAIGKGMPHPTAQHQSLVQNSLVFLHLKNDALTPDERRTAFKKYEETTLAEIQKYPDESREEHELRKRLRQHSMELLEQWFVETAQIDYTLQVDKENGQAPSQLKFNALPETSLAQGINRLADSASYFAAIPKAENSIVSVRAHIPLDQKRIEGYREIYKMTRPVIEQKIKEGTSRNDSQKAAQQEVANLILDVVDESAQLAVADSFLEITPSGNQHVIVLGVRTAAKEKLDQLISKLPETTSDWSIALNVDSAEGTSIHKLSLGSALPNALKEFYGDSGDIFLATSDEAFWLAGGQGSLDKLKSHITTVAQSEKPAADGVLVSATLQSQPLLKHLHAYLEESDSLLLKTLRNQREERAARLKDDEAEEETDRPARVAGNLANFEWEQTAIESMEGLNDLFEIEIKRTADNTLEGQGNAQIGVLKALGALIAKFSDENLK